MVTSPNIENTIDDYELIARGRSVFLQHHVPEVMDAPYHVHPSIEINYLQGCEMVYSFGGRPVAVPPSRFCIFWAAQPHRVQAVHGRGKITNAYIPLEEFWDWPLPKPFTDALMGGGVALATKPGVCDDAIVAQLVDEIAAQSDEVGRLHCLELQARITRMALSGWELIAPVRTNLNLGRIGGNAIAHFETMLRFVAAHYSETITLPDVAQAAGLSENYANALFRKIIGTTIKAHVTNVRIFRARMLLAETDEKIISIALDCGFGSLSSFYDAFQRRIGASPAEFRARARKPSRVESATERAH